MHRLIAQLYALMLCLRSSIEYRCVLRLFGHFPPRCLGITMDQIKSPCFQPPTAPTGLLTKSHFRSQSVSTMSNAARAAPSTARRKKYRPHRSRKAAEEAKRKRKDPSGSTLSQNVSEASTSQSPALRAVQSHSTRGRRPGRAYVHCKAIKLLPYSQGD